MSTKKKAKTAGGFSAAERAAMQERARELKTAARRGSRASKADVEAEVLARLDAMPEADRRIGRRLHEIVRENAPELVPRLWYGMPAYARDDKVVCFFQGAQKFSTRYCTIGFSDQANLDDGQLWPTAFAVKELTAPVEKQLAALVKQAASQP
jgi:uncharacterized protein YdhG (YjbR/CyaY superfamily)